MYIVILIHRKVYFSNLVSDSTPTLVRMTIVIKAVVFDLDGTLASFNLDYRAVRTMVRRHLEKKGFQSQFCQQKKTYWKYCV